MKKSLKIYIADIMVFKKYKILFISKKLSDFRFIKEGIDLTSREKVKALRKINPDIVINRWSRRWN